MRFWQISVIKERARGGWRAREFVRMKKPEPWAVETSSALRTGTVQVVRTLMPWQLRNCTCQLLVNVVYDILPEETEDTYV